MIRNASKGQMKGYKLDGRILTKKGHNFLRKIDVSTEKISILSVEIIRKNGMDICRGTEIQLVKTLGKENQHVSIR